MMTSRPVLDFGSGTLSQRMSPLPCHVSAFIVEFSASIADEKIESDNLFLSTGNARE